MRISLTQLTSLQVETQRGDVLGRVFDLIFELDGQLVAQYLVRPSRFSRTVYTISRDHVVTITETKMIVEDAVLRIEIAASAKKQPIPDPEPVAMRE